MLVIWLNREAEFGRSFGIFVAVVHDGIFRKVREFGEGSVHLLRGTFNLGSTSCRHRQMMDIGQQIAPSKNRPHPARNRVSLLSGKP